MLPQLLVLLAAVGGSALVAGFGVWLWTRAEGADRRGVVGQGGDRAALERELEGVREELETTREETRRLAERVDFLERLLESGEGGDGEVSPRSGP